MFWSPVHGPFWRGNNGTLELEVQPAIVPELQAHTAHFEKKIYKVGERVYSAVGWNISNVIMIEGHDSIVIVDAGLSPETTAEVLTEFRKITSKPIAAIIYSHFHHDHIDGVRGLVDEAQIEKDGVRIIAHQSFMSHLADESHLLGPILAARGGYTFRLHVGASRSGRDERGYRPLAGRWEARHVHPAQ